MKYYEYLDMYSRIIYKDIFEEERRIGKIGIYSTQFFKKYKEIFNLNLESIDNNKLNDYDLLINKILDQINIPKNRIGTGFFYGILIYFFGSFLRDIWIDSENIRYGSQYYIFVYFIWIASFVIPIISGISDNEKNKTINIIISKYKNNASKILNIKTTKLENQSLKDKLTEILEMLNKGLIDHIEYKRLRDKVLNET